MRYTTPSTLEALKYHGGRNDGFRDRRFVNSDNHTDQPIGIKLAEDDYVRVRYDAKTMRWILFVFSTGLSEWLSKKQDIANRPSRIKYQTAKELIKQYRYRRVCYRR